MASELVVILNTTYRDHGQKQAFLLQQASLHRWHASRSVPLDHD